MIAPVQRWSLAAVWACVAVAVGAVAAGLGLRSLDPSPPPVSDLAVALLSAPILVVAVAVGRRMPANAVAAVMGLFGLLPAAEMALDAWASAASAGAAAGAGWAVLLLQRDWILVFLALTWLLLLFPTGRPLGPRWRLAVYGAGVAAGATALLSALSQDRFDPPYEAVAHPLAGAPVPPEGLRMVAVLALFAAVLSGFASAVVRFRRARGVERVQLTWLAAAAVLVPLALAIGIVEGGEGPGPLTAASFAVAVLGVVAAVGVAILRHGLYDADRVLSRTLAWSTLTLLLAAAFVGVAVAVAVPLGGGSAVGTGVAALVVALLFTPLRRRLQRAVDRCFDRERANAVERIEAFAGDLRDGRAAPEAIEGVLREVLHDPSLALLVWLPDEGAYADLAGRPAPEPVEAPARALTGVGRGDAPLGAVVHDPRLRERPVLLADVLRAAALPIEVARLRCGLRRQLEEVRASRARIVAAGDEERRRLERDLHDGVQQRLVALGMGLRRTQRLSALAPEVGRSLDLAVDEIQEAVSDLREIARGLRPGTLDAGLGAALADLARRTPLDIEVSVPRERLPQQVETAAYDVVCEAVANVVKHAGASRADASVAREDGVVRVRVVDDGRGGAAVRSGGGLAGLADRVAAHGGSMEIDSRPGDGTRLEVTLPCGS